MIQRRALPALRFLQDDFVILATVENSEDRNLPGIGLYGKSDHGTLAVVRDAQPKAKIVAHDAALRKGGQRKAEVCDGIRVASGDLRLRGPSDVLVQCDQLLPCLG